MTLRPITLDSLLTAEHGRTRAGLAELAHQLAASNWPAASATLISITRDLQIHYACEEHSLFAVLSAYRTMGLMHTEHDRLLDQQAELAQALAEIQAGMASPEKVQSVFETWRETLDGHMREEESGLVKLADAHLEPEEVALALRKFQALRDAMDAGHTDALALLKRPTPAFTVTQTALGTTSAKPVRYVKTFETPQTSLHQLHLAAGAKLAEHWAGQQQIFTVLTGRVIFTANGESVALSAGAQLAAEPGLRLALHAETDADLMVLKLWPLPHFIRL